jgi:YVTN family beta-propeller protein
MIMKKETLFLLFTTVFLFAISAEKIHAEMYAYVPNSDDNTVSVILVADHTVVATIDVGDSPEGVAVTPDGRFVYVTNSISDNVSVIDTSNNSVETIVLASNSLPRGVAVSPKGLTAFVSNSLSGTLSVIRTSDNAVADNVAVGNRPQGVAVLSNGIFAYVVNSLDNNVSVINTAVNLEVATIAVDTLPRSIVATPQGDFIYVTNFLAGTVSVVRTSDNVVIQTIGVGNGPNGIAITPNGEFVFISNTLADTISTIQTSNNTIINTIGLDAGSNPSGVSVTPDGKFIYVTNTATNTVSVIRISDNSIIATVNVGNSPISLGNFIGDVPDPPTGAVLYSGGGSGCFIATAAFGSQKEQNVRILQEFRDIVLLSHPLGEFIVSLYYRISPPIADFIRDRNTLRAWVRLCLLPLVGIGWVSLKIGPMITMSLLFLLGIGFACLIKFEKTSFWAAKIRMKYK